MLCEMVEKWKCLLSTFVATLLRCQSPPAMRKLPEGFHKNVQKLLNALLKNENMHNSCSASIVYFLTQKVRIIQISVCLNQTSL